MRTHKIRKKCDFCGRTQVVPFARGTCGLSRLGGKPCSGRLEYYSGDFDDSILNLLAMANEISDESERHLNTVTPANKMLKHAIEDVETWVAESGNTPASMGWVGKDALP